MISIAFVIHAFSLIFYKTCSFPLSDNIRCSIVLLHVVIVELAYGKDYVNTFW